jgi:hypothetical protein
VLYHHRYPIVAPKKAPDIADNTVMIARIITPQIFFVGIGFVVSMSIIIYNFVFEIVGRCHNEVNTFPTVVTHKDLTP